MASVDVVTCYLCGAEAIERMPSGVPMCGRCRRREFGTTTIAAPPADDWDTPTPTEEFTPWASAKPSGAPIGLLRGMVRSILENARGREDLLRWERMLGTDPKYYATAEDLRAAGIDTPYLDAEVWCLPIAPVASPSLDPRWETHSYQHAPGCNHHECWSGGEAFRGAPRCTGTWIPLNART